MVGAKKMSEVKKRLMKRVTVEYYEELTPMNPTGTYGQRSILVETKKETWCESSKGDPVITYTSEVY